jgi:hypothetical protein
LKPYELLDVSPGQGHVSSLAGRAAKRAGRAIPSRLASGMPVGPAPSATPFRRSRSSRRSASGRILTAPSRCRLPLRKRESSAEQTFRGTNWNELNVLLVRTPRRWCS